MINQLCNIFYKNKVFVRLCLPLRNILDQESICVIPGKEDLSDYTLDSFFWEIQVVGSDQGRVDQVKSDGICSELVAYIDRVRIVFESFWHFLSICRQHQSVYDEILVRIAVLDTSWKDVQSVEPSSGLINTLTDEISREDLRKLFFVCWERVVDLSIGHGTTFEPAIKDLLNTS